MARMPRLVVPQYPHHVTQRGNRKQKTFFRDADFRLYLDMIVEAKAKAGAEVLAYCLMPNHVHFIIVPEHIDSLARLFSDAHRRYTCTINKRKGWRGHLWQERFYSCVLDEPHLLAAVRYVELNPVRANLCAKPDQWAWSSVRAHMRGRSDRLVNVTPMINLVGNWSDYLAVDEMASSVDAIRQHTRTGRPVGSTRFITSLENMTGRRLRRKRPGRPASR